MLHVIEAATKMYREDRATFDSLAIRAMRQSYGWDRSAKEYLKLYEKACK